MPHTLFNQSVHHPTVATSIQRNLHTNTNPKLRPRSLPPPFSTPLNTQPYKVSTTFITSSKPASPKPPFAPISTDHTPVSAPVSRAFHPKRQPTKPTARRLGGAGSNAHTRIAVMMIIQQRYTHPSPFRVLAPYSYNHTIQQQFIPLSDEGNFPQCAALAMMDSVKGAFNMKRDSRICGWTRLI